MKQVFILVLMLLVVATATHSYAQAPQSFKYQSIARDGADVLIADANIQLEISIHDLTPTGTVVYKERHSVTTNSLGLFTISVGGGTIVSGTFETIAWGSGSKFIEVASDFSGGTNFTSMGTSQLLSVPYALHSGNGWGLTGNSVTVDGTHFIGTTDDVPLNFKVNNATAGRITSTGATFFGSSAGTYNGDKANTGYGYFALFTNTSGTENTAIGAEALRSNIHGERNTAIGTSSLYSNNGTYNTAVGYRTLYYNIGGLSNTAIGSNSLVSNVEGNGNTAIGSVALSNNTSGGANTAIGILSLYSNTTGEQNTAIGREALMYNSTGNNNIALGMYSLVSNISGSSNIAIGNYANVSSGSLTNATAIGNSAIVDASNKVRIGSSAVTVVEVPVAVTVASDARLKDNIRDSELGLEFITKIHPVQYTMKTGNGKTDYGFIAQELKEVLAGRNVNMLNKDGEYYHVRYNDLIAPMVKAIQEQQKIIQDMKSEMLQLKSRLESKNAENSTLKSDFDNRIKRLEAMLVTSPQN